MNKKVLSLVGFVTFFAFTAYITYKILGSVEGVEFEDIWQEETE